MLNIIKGPGFTERSLRAAFTLVELLVVIAILALVAAILLPVFAEAQEKGRQSVCESNLRQIGMATSLYVGDNDELLPSRIDLKNSPPGGWKPWTTWPTSDPRAAWAAILFQPYIKTSGIWSCPSVAGAFPGALQVEEATDATPAAITTRYWMWRFDTPIVPKPGPNGPTFWGMTEEQAVMALQVSGNTTIDPLNPQGVADVEMVVDPYFPTSVPNPPPGLIGRAVHMGGRNRLFLDGHVAWKRDIRTQ